MQSSLAIFAGLILGLYLDQKHQGEAPQPIKVSLHKISLSLPQEMYGEQY